MQRHITKEPGFLSYPASAVVSVFSKQTEYSDGGDEFWEAEVWEGLREEREGGGREGERREGLKREMGLNYVMWQMMNGRGNLEAISSLLP